MKNITIKEILIGIIVMVVFIGVGVFLAPIIQSGSMGQFKIMSQAIQNIEDPDLFAYERKTHAGEVFAYGTVKSVDRAWISDLENQYSAIEKVTERYTKHQYESCDSYDKNGKCTKYSTKYTYSWDRINTSISYCKEFKFLGYVFLSERVHFPIPYRVDLSKEVASQYSEWVRYNYIYNNGDFWTNEGDLRYYYNYLPLEFKASILFGFFDDDFSNPFDRKLKYVPTYFEQTPDQAISFYRGSIQLTGIIIVVLFCLGAGALWFVISYEVIEVE